MAFRTTAATSKDSLSYEVIEECGKVFTNSKGEELKLRFIAWNGRDPKYDLRYWYTDDKTGEEKMRKGITLSGEELSSLCQVLKEIESA